MSYSCFGEVVSENDVIGIVPCAVEVCIFVELGQEREYFAIFELNFFVSCFVVFFKIKYIIYGHKVFIKSFG